MKIKYIIITIALSVFLVGISAISADDDTDIFTKDFTIGESNFTTLHNVNNVKSNNTGASFIKDGYVLEIKKMSDDDFNKYKKNGLTTRKMTMVHPWRRFLSQDL